MPIMVISSPVADTDQERYQAEGISDLHLPAAMAAFIGGAIESNPVDLETERRVEGFFLGELARRGPLLEITDRTRSGLVRGRKQTRAVKARPMIKQN